MAECFAVTLREFSFSFQVCLGDRIIVDVENGMEGQSATIHWHGAYQRGSPYMDGVPMVTQCPITEMTTFRYDFRVTNFGTLYWHSHDGKNLNFCYCLHNKYLYDCLKVCDSGWFIIPILYSALSIS
jgi:hypothetical protein